MSIFKRLFGEKDEINNSSTQVFKTSINNSNIKSMGSNLQKRFSRGVQYNMKIVIRGDRNVGKSALLARLKGLDFCDQYIPTDEIEVACIHWNYKTNDVVKVEVWDVVDKGRKKKQSGLKLENSCSVEENPGSLCLDAEFLDVYKGAHAVIMVLDITKSWTFNYVERELQYIPEDLPILVLGNHRDMGSHRTISSDQIQMLVESMPSFNKGLAKYWESSMKNGYGLIYIHRFFNIPFLQLQKDTLLKQLATNEKEMNAAIQELDELEDEPDSVYDNFIANLKQSKSVGAHCQKPSSLALHSNPVSQINSPITPGSASQLPHKASLTPMTDSASHISERSVIHPPQARPIPGMDKLGLYPLPVPSDNRALKDENITLAKQPDSNQSKNIDKKNIDEFVPDDQPELSSFLEEFTSKRSLSNPKLEKIDSSSSDENDDNQRKSVKRQNPMVASFDDEIDIDDVPAVDNSMDNCSFVDDVVSSDDDVARVGKPFSTPPLDGMSSKKHFDGVVSEISENKENTNKLKLDNGHEECNSIIFVERKISSLDIADKISMRKELDADDTTANSSNSVKKKKKKHHKESGNKDAHSRKKKKRSKTKSEDNSSLEITKSSPPNTRKISKKSEDCSEMNHSKERFVEVDFDSKRSDSLERFLND